MPLAPPYVDYKPNPDVPGGYDFVRADGKSYLAYGDAADQLRRSIDASRPPDQRLASNDPPYDPNAEVLARNAAQTKEDLASHQTRTDATLAENAKTPQQKAKESWDAIGQYDAKGNLIGPPTAGPMGPPEAPPAPPAVAKAAPPPTPATSPKARVSRDVSPPSGELPSLPTGENPSGGESASAGPSVPTMKYVAGRDPAREARTAVAVPTQQSLVTEGGIMDPASRQKAQEAYDAQVSAQRNLAEVQSQGALTQIAYQKAEMAEASRKQAEAEQEVMRAQARQTVIRDEFQKRMNIAGDNYDSQSKREVDQYRVFRGKPGARIVSFFSIILSGIGQGLAKSNTNMALEAVNREMDNDIAAQRDEIRQGVASSANDLARIRDQYGLDTDDAASILKLNYAKRADAEAQKKAAFLGTQQAQLQYAQIAPQFQKWQADAAESLRANLEGKVKTVQESKMVVPSRGGVRPLSLHEQAQAAKDIDVITHGGVASKFTAPKKEGEITPNLSRAAVATDEALSSLYRLRSRLGKEGLIGRTLDSAKKFGADSTYMAEVNHAAQAIASAEAKGLAPDIKRVQELETGKLGSLNTDQGLTHIDALIEQMKTQRDTIRSVSSRTGKVGNIGGGDSDSGGEE